MQGILELNQISVLNTASCNYNVYAIIERGLQSVDLDIDPEGIDACGARRLRQALMLRNSQNTVGGKADQIALCVQIEEKLPKQVVKWKS